MYKSFFHLQSNPFAGSPDPRFMYMMPHTREALATLKEQVKNKPVRRPATAAAQQTES